MNHEGHVEVDGTYQARLIIKGTWLYDGTKQMFVEIFALNYDYYFDLDRGYNDEGQQPELNSRGEQYVVIWSDESFFSASGFPSNGFMSVQEAKKYAEEIVKHIEWSQPITQDFI